MSGSPVLVTAPTSEPITRTEVKLHLRVDVDITAEDALIDAHIIAARRLVETHTGRQLITATWDLFLPGFPDCDVLALPNPPLQSVTSITYYDTAETPT